VFWLTLLLPDADLVILVCQVERPGRVLPVEAEDLTGSSGEVLEAAARRSLGSMLLNFLLSKMAVCSSYTNILPNEHCKLRFCLRNDHL